MIIKTTDTAQGSGGMELLRNEATTAALLEPLWNRTVPPLLTSGFVAPCVYANVFKKIEGQVITAAALAQALEALKSVHGLGFLHGDVKADHFLATKAGQVYLVDFGLSRRATGKGEFAREERELWHSLR